MGNREDIYTCGGGLHLNLWNSISERESQKLETFVDSDFKQRTQNRCSYVYLWIRDVHLYI